MTFYTRNLPHWHPEGKDIFIAWRLFGSLPAHIEIQKCEEPPGKQFLNYDRALDQAQNGPLWLKHPRVAECVVAALRKGQSQEVFRMHAYAIMANHVHVMIEPLVPIARITKAIKGATAREANRFLNRTGTFFWQDESFDRWIRTPQEWDRIRTYIERNPVSAGLVTKPEDWPWSSASRPIE